MYVQKHVIYIYIFVTDNVYNSDFLYNAHCKLSNIDSVNNVNNLLIYSIQLFNSSVFTYGVLCGFFFGRVWSFFRQVKKNKNVFKFFFLNG